MNYFVLAFERSFEFSGRSSRAEYWWFTLFYVLGIIALGVLGALLRSGLVTSLILVVALASSITCLSLGVRRMHDLGRTGWLVLVSWIPFVGALIFLVLAALPGQQEENRFGPPPTALG